MAPIAAVGTAEAICLAIEAAAKATERICDVLLSPEGQKTIAYWRDTDAHFRESLDAFGKSILSIGDALQFHAAVKTDTVSVGVKTK